MITILAEKPSVARDIAAIVGATKKADGYLYGGGYSVTWAFGHLVQLAMPEEYGAVGFNREHLPIIPDSFKLVVRQVRDGKIYKSDSGAAKQLKVIAKLFDECDTIIVATDAGREGELIFRYIYNYLSCNKPFQRLWISSLTDSAISEGLNNLKGGAEYDNLYAAAKARSEADWLVGINATQALTLSARGGIYSLGRVQTPTLKMICERFDDNKKFLSKEYFQIKPQLEVGLSPISNIKYDSFSQCEGDSTRLWQMGNIIVDDISEKIAIEKSPLLYDLTTLQKDANKRFEYTAQETLSIAQSLYEKKYISYPRTGSRYISDDIFSEMDSILGQLSLSEKWSKFIEPLIFSKCSDSVDNNKITDHHAILVTNVTPSALSDKEQNIYDMIAIRILESLMPACHKSYTTFTFNGRGNFYTSKVMNITLKGWRAVRQDEGEEECEYILPKLNIGDECVMNSVETVTKHTKPKAIHTESSLLSAMETASKEVENEQERVAMKELGLGTPATRAATIETLFTRGYIIREKRSLIPTEKGLAVYNAVKDMQIANVQLTGEWENGLHSIEDGSLDSDTFNNISREYTRQITAELLSKEIATPDIKYYDCPKCGKSSVRIFDKVAKCTVPNCEFVIFRKIAGKRISDKHIEELITKGKTATIKGFKSNAGKSFDAALVLNESHKAVFQFTANSKSKKKGVSKLK